MNKYKEYCEKIIDTIKLFEEHEIKDIINEYNEHTNQYANIIMDYEELLNFIQNMEEEKIFLIGVNAKINIYTDNYFQFNGNGYLRAVDLNTYFDMISYEIAEYMIDNENCFYYTALEEIVEDFWKD